MTLEKSSSISVTQAELYTIKNGAVPEALESLGYSLEDLQAKVEAEEVKVVSKEPKKMSFTDPNKAL